MAVSTVFPTDRWPKDHTALDGVRRIAFYSYEVEEPTAVMTFSDAGEANNPDGINRVVVELAVLKEDTFEANLAGMIAAVTQDLEPETISIDQIPQRFEGVDGRSPVHCFFCHPDTNETALKALSALSLPIAMHEAFPTSKGEAVIVLTCKGLPGLIAEAEAGSGAFIFPKRFMKIRITLAGSSAWDRLLRDDLLG